MIPFEGGSMLRAASGDLDTARNTVTVRFHVWQLRHDRLVAETDETHLMRYFFLPEIKLLLECSGLTLLGLGAFQDFDRLPDETTWNVLGVARAVAVPAHGVFPEEGRGASPTADTTRSTV
jgi:hypothetical protein